MMHLSANTTDWFYSYSLNKKWKWVPYKNYWAWKLLPYTVNQELIFGPTGRADVPCAAHLMWPMSVLLTLEDLGVCITSTSLTLLLRCTLNGLWHLSHPHPNWTLNVFRCVGTKISANAFILFIYSLTKGAVGFGNYTLVLWLRPEMGKLELEITFE